MMSKLKGMETGPWLHWQRWIEWQWQWVRTFGCKLQWKGSCEMWHPVPAVLSTVTIWCRDKLVELSSLMRTLEVHSMEKQIIQWSWSLTACQVMQNDTMAIFYHSSNVPEKTRPPGLSLKQQEALRIKITVWNQCS